VTRRGRVAFVGGLVLLTVLALGLIWTLGQYGAPGTRRIDELTEQNKRLERTLADERDAHAADLAAAAIAHATDAGRIAELEEQVRVLVFLLGLLGEPSPVSPPPVRSATPTNPGAPSPTAPETAPAPPAPAPPAAEEPPPVTNRGGNAPPGRQDCTVDLHGRCLI
jgi:hypothetical protein